MNQGNGLNPSSSIVGGTSGITKTTIIKTDLVAGVNSIAYSVTGTVTWINVHDNDNRPLEFSDIKWNGTSIELWSDESISVIFVIEYKS